MVKIQLHPQGTRVRIRPGRFPFDPTQLGRVGTVIHLLRGGDRYGVQIDGEDSIRVFAEDELESERTHRFLTAEAGEPRGGTGSDSPS